MLVLLNVLIVALVCLPLLLLWRLRSRSDWVERNHEMLGILVWLVTLLAVYIWVLPMLGLRPNPRLFDS
jgi:uncharacterized membrane protein YagU involved in acid resistance